MDRHGRHADFRLDTCAVRVALPLLAPPCGWRSPNDLDVAANAAASAGSYGQRIEGKRCANRYPTLEIPTQYIFALFLQPNELALDPRRVRKLRKEPACCRASRSDGHLMGPMAGLDNAHESAAGTVDPGSAGRPCRASDLPQCREWFLRSARQGARAS